MPPSLGTLLDISTIAFAAEAAAVTLTAFISATWSAKPFIPSPRGIKLPANAETALALLPPNHDCTPPSLGIVLVILEMHLATSTAALTASTFDIPDTALENPNMPFPRGIKFPANCATPPPLLPPNHDCTPPSLGIVLVRSAIAFATSMAA